MEDILSYSSPNLVGFFQVIVARFISEHLSLAQAKNNFENDQPSMTLILCVA